MTGLSFTPLDSVIGADVHGADLRRPPDGAIIEAIEVALERHGVLVFRDQDITPAQQIAFTRPFGVLECTPNDGVVIPDHPEVFVIGNAVDPPVLLAPEGEDGVLEWHTDRIHHEVPSRAALLTAKAVPRVGGDTLFACMYTAYEALPAAERARCDGLRVVNSITGLRHYLEDQGHQSTADRYSRLESPHVRPLVRRHPRTGRKALYFGSHTSVDIVGWPRERARAFIRELIDHACQESFQCRHLWRVGDAVMWDNRRLLHAATPFNLDTETRLMHRTTLLETEPLE